MYQKNNTQYNKYPKNKSGSDGGTAKITSTKKSGCILEVKLNNQDLVLKGFWDNRENGWKLFPYYNKSKSNPSFNQPKQSYQKTHELDDELPQHMKEFHNSPAPNETDFNPDQYEQELG